MKAQLTKEQSQHLIDLGVPKEKASRTETIKYGQVIAKDSLGNSLSTIGEYAPIFTLTDLLEILPKEIDIPYCDRFCIMNYMGDYEVGYGFVDPNEGFFFEKSCQETELIDALYELCVWCLEQGYFKFE